jgi:phage-related protein
MNAVRAKVSWEGDSREVLRTWPKSIREDFGVALAEMQAGRPATLRVRPMPSIASGVFELKDQDDAHWYRLIYMARVNDIIYVLHAFIKTSAKTDRRDLATAERRWKAIQQRNREGF